MPRHILLCVTVVLPLLAAPTTTRISTAQSLGLDGGSPITIPRSQYWDITSKLNGETYRIMVWTPMNARRGDAGKSSVQPGTTYPVFYALDGNQNFGLATDMMTRLVYLEEVTPSIVVGIGYPTDDPLIWNQRRAFDLTESASPTTRGPGGPLGYGGAEVFFRLIEDQVKPLVAARYPVDPSRQILYGSSYAGQFVLRVLFRNYSAFSTFIVSSPSIWWNDEEILAYEEAFSRRARTGVIHRRLLLTSAGDEQYRGPDPDRLAAARRTRMVDNASELAARLAMLHPHNLKVVRVIFDGETHNSVPASAVTRGIRFALATN